MDTRRVLTIKEMYDKEWTTGRDYNSSLKIEMEKGDFSYELTRHDTGEPNLKLTLDIYNKKTEERVFLNDDELQEPLRNLLKHVLQKISDQKEIEYQRRTKEDQELVNYLLNEK